MRILATLLVVASAAGCRATPPETPPATPPRVVVAEVEAKVAAGRPDQARLILDAALAERPADAPSALLAFTDAWLEEVSARSRPDAERTRGLQQAAEKYRRVLRLAPGDPDTVQNLVLVLRDLRRFAEALEELGRLSADMAGRRALLEGLLLADENNTARDSERATERLDAAAREAGTDEALALVGLYGELLAQDVGSEVLETLALGLLHAAETFSERGEGAAAVFGFETLIQRCGPYAEEALAGWVRTEAARDGLNPERLVQLAPCPLLEPAVRELQGLLAWMPALDEPHPALPVLPFWTSSPARYDAVVGVLATLARSRAYADEPELAEALLLAAFALGLDERCGPEAWLDAALDLAVLLHRFRERLDPDREKLKALVDKPPIVGLNEANPEAVERVERRSDAARIQAVLGIVLGELGRWSGRARYHLERAAELRKDADPEKRDRLLGLVAVGLAENVQPMDEFLESARGHLDHGDRAAARALRAPARAFARDTHAKAAELEELLYPTLGFYVAGTYGGTDGHESGTTLQGALLRRGHATSVALDDAKAGARLALGYRFAAPLAVELGYTSLKGPSSVITEQTIPSMPAQLVRDVVALHPIAGKGPTLSLLWFPLQRDRFSVYLEGGLWHWDSVVDVDLVIGGSKVQIDETGTDLFFGAGGEVRLRGKLRGRGALQRYLLAGDAVDFLSLGFVLGL